jgi:ketosteroid isomerase-like protein
MALQPKRGAEGEMRTGTVLVAFLTTSFFVALGCGPSEADRRADDLAALRATDRQWSATAAKKNLEGTLSFYANDAVLLPPNAPMATNARAIRASWANLLGPNTTVSWVATRGDIAESGELAYLYGTYQLSMRDPNGGPAVQDTGKFAEIWKREPDGPWKCVVDTYNSDLPVAGGKS